MRKRPGTFVQSGCPNATVTLDNCFIANDNVGIQAGNPLSSTAGTVRLKNSTIVDNYIGLSTTNKGLIVSFANNAIYGNGIDSTPSQTVPWK